MEKGKAVMDLYARERQEPASDLIAFVQTLLAVITFLTLLFTYMFLLMY